MKGRIFSIGRQGFISSITLVSRVRVDRRRGRACHGFGTGSSRRTPGGDTPMRMVLCLELAILIQHLAYADRSA